MLGHASPGDGEAGMLERRPLFAADPAGISMTHVPPKVLSSIKVHDDFRLPPLLPTRLIGHCATHINTIHLIFAGRSEANKTWRHLLSEVSTAVARMAQSSNG